MSGRQRVVDALGHREPAKVPMDFGATAVTGIAASLVYRLRQALGLDEPGTPVKVVEPYQMLGEVAPDLRETLGIDTVGLPPRTTLFGFANRDWKPWTLFDGTPVLVPGAFNTEPEEDGSILMYPEGDRGAPPSGRMPADGYYFDTIVRQPPIVDAELRVEDNLEEFALLDEEALASIARDVAALQSKTDAAIVAGPASVGFGDIALVPAPFLKHPKGIRDVEEWYISTVTRREHVRAIFERQCEIGIENLRRAHAVVADRIQVLFVTGTDFGTQRGPFISPDAYRDLYKPFHKRVNGWVHEHTQWKTFIHSCGGIEPLIADFVDAGFDILNPVQCSAEGMGPAHLKQEYGRDVTFWGGGVDTQKTLPFGTPDEVRREVRERVQVFGEGGGFVFNAIHNMQANTPTENALAMFEAFAESR
jgi:hypothetical protein